jgi:MoaA/NifB/PqqE/SkfB family radical SAM enzyme
MIDGEITVGKSPPLIRGVDFSLSEIEVARENDKLLTLTYFVSNRCNFNCPYCYIDGGDELDNELSFSEFSRVVNQARELGASTLWIPGAGEPFLDHNFYCNNGFPIIDYANSIGMNVTFFTNGYFVTEEIARELMKRNVSIVTKINSFSPVVQDLLAGKKGAYRGMQAGLGYLLEAGFNKGDPTRLGINTVITQQNYSEILGVFVFCRLNNIVPYISTTLHGGRACRHPELDVPLEQVRDLFDRALEIDQREYGHTWIPSPPIMADQCRKLYYDIVVTSTGDVKFCPGLPISIGSVRDKSLSEIIAGSELLHRIRNMKNHLKGKCGSCNNDSCAYGCRLEAYSSGDLFGEDPGCWKTC